MKNHTISQDVTLLEALSHICELAPEPLVLFVLNNKNQMVGTLTDGDSRRALITGASVSDTVDKIMHRNFNYMKVEELDDVKELKRQKELKMKLVPVLDKENHIVVDDADKLKDCPEDLYISGGASVYAKFFTTPAIMPDIVVDCVYQGEIAPEVKDLINVNKSVEVLESKYFALPLRFELDNVITTVWLKKGDFVEQSVVKNILTYLETEGK